jgi:hypothetical protein
MTCLQVKDCYEIERFPPSAPRGEQFSRPGLLSDEGDRCKTAYGIGITFLGIAGIFLEAFVPQMKKSFE